MAFLHPFLPSTVFQISEVDDGVDLFGTKLRWAGTSICVPFLCLILGNAALPLSASDRICFLCAFPVVGSYFWTFRTSYLKTTRSAARNSMTATICTKRANSSAWTSYRVALVYTACVSGLGGLGKHWSVGVSFRKAAVFTFLFIILITHSIAFIVDRLLLKYCRIVDQTDRDCTSRNVA